MDNVDELGQQFRRVKIHRTLIIVVAVSAVESAGVVTSQLLDAQTTLPQADQIQHHQRTENEAVRLHELLLTSQLRRRARPAPDSWRPHFRAIEAESLSPLRTAKSNEQYRLQCRGVITPPPLGSSWNLRQTRCCL